jgi:hypothetical protein
MMTSSAKPLRLLAEDEADLAVMAAALQDAVAKLGDIAFDARARTLTVGCNRYRWEARGKDRVRAGLQLNGVLGVQSHKLRRGASDAVVDLLDIAFEPGEAPGGTIILKFAGGGALRCAVECIDAVLADVSTPWPARGQPQHGA